VPARLASARFEIGRRIRKPVMPNITVKA
jgi:hypothetical protein